MMKQCEDIKKGDIIEVGERFLLGYGNETWVVENMVRRDYTNEEPDHTTKNKWEWNKETEAWEGAGWRAIEKVSSAA